jgi:hypothetical protein
MVEVGGVTSQKARTPNPTTTTIRQRVRKPRTSRLIARRLRWKCSADAPLKEF